MVVDKLACLFPRFASPSRSLALLGRVEEARAAWKNAGPHVSRDRMRHSARFTGAGLARLAEGLRLAGWDGSLR